MNSLYIPRQDDPAICDDVAWGEWFEVNCDTQRIGWTMLGTALVSTVLLGVDHGDDPEKPVLFKTTVFRYGSDEEDYVARCSTLAEAEEQHAVAVRWARAREQEAAEAAAP